MKLIYNSLKILLLFFFLLSFCANSVLAQNVNLSGTIYNLKHNFQCGDDGALGQDPHPPGNLGLVITISPIPM